MIDCCLPQGSTNLPADPSVQACASNLSESLSQGPAHISQPLDGHRFFTLTSVLCSLAQQPWLTRSFTNGSLPANRAGHCASNGHPPPGVLLNYLGINRLLFRQAQGRSPETRVPFACVADSVPLVAETTELILKGGTPHTLTSPVDVQILLFLPATSGSYFLPSSTHPSGTCKPQAANKLGERKAQP